MYIPLHNHSEYSFFDGYSHPKEMATRAKEIGAPAIALTDHGTMNGVVRFIEACRKESVKPILGCELYWTEDMEKKDKETKTHHLVAWARTLEGYRNLLAISSTGHLEGAYGMRKTPRIDDDILRKYGQGIIASSSCINGRIPALLLAGRFDEAVEVAQEYARIFDQFVLELQPQDIPEQYIINREIIRLAEKTGLPLIVTTDSHYAVKDDAKHQDVLLAIQTQDTMNNPDRFRMHGETYWIKTEEEIYQSLLWGDPNNPEPMPRSLILEAMRGTVDIADQCNVEIELKKNKFPRFPLPPGENEAEALRRLAQEGLFEKVLRLGITDVETYQQRLQDELDVITSKGYAGYFLMVSDLIRYGKSRDYAFGPGRGSGGGSAVSWALDITSPLMDPIKLDMIFERFLNPERESPPDIDIDIESEKRGEMIQYLRDKYGSDHVAQIGNVTTMACKDAFRRTAKAFGVTHAEAESLSKQITASKLEKEEDPRIKKFLEDHPEITEAAIHLQDRAFGRSIHAGGVVIAPDNILNHTALQLGNEGELVTQADMHDIEQLGLLKIDLLGVKTIDVVSRAVRLANDPELTWEWLNEKIDLDSPIVYELLRQKRTDSLFQIESSLMKKIIEEVQPNSFEDLVVIISLGRPGPMSMIPTYARRKHGIEPVTYLHPKLEPVLKKTYGIFVYQEQVMKAAQVLAGYTLGQADILRRAMGKKEQEVMDAEKDRFIQGCKKHSGIEPEKAAEIWDQINAFAGYGFNRSHAVAYAIVAVWTAYLKLKAPKAYWCAVISNEVNSNAKDKDEKVRIYVAEARKDGVAFLPPDVNRSDFNFTLEEKGIRWGLSGLKGVGPKAIEDIVAKRPFESLDDFLERCDRRQINKGCIRALVFSGAFDGLANTDDRGAIWNQVLEWRKKNKMPVSDEDWFLVGEYGEDDRIADEIRIMNVPVTGRSKWEKISDGQTCEIRGAIENVRPHKDRNGNEMAFVTFETSQGESIDMVCFASTYSKVKSLLKKGREAIVSGKRQEHSLIINNVVDPKKSKPKQTKEKTAPEPPILKQEDIFALVV